MTLSFLLSLILLASLVLYALSGGADFGGGMWDLLAFGPGARRQRAAIEEAIAPIWEANHVWLILAIVLTFVAFPGAFGIMMTALHIPMTAILVGIVLRGAAFVFRKYDAQTDEVHRRWSTLFGISSFFTPFLLGLSLGALASGEIRVVNGTLTTGFFAGWTTLFAVTCGLFAQGLFAFLAAVYMTVSVAGDSELEEAFRRRALIAGVLLAPAAALAFLAARSGAPLIYSGLTSWWAAILLALTSIAALTALWGLWVRRFRTARAGAVAQVALIVVGWGIAQSPYIVVPDLTFANTAGPQATLQMLIIALAAGALVLFPSFGYLYYIFQRRAA